MLNIGTRSQSRAFLQQTRSNIHQYYINNPIVCNTVMQTSILWDPGWNKLDVCFNSRKRRQIGSLIQMRPQTLSSRVKAGVA